jgi:hypothetical protein
MTPHGRALRLLLLALTAVLFVAVSREQPRSMQSSKRPWASQPQKPIRHVRPDMRYLR